MNATIEQLYRFNDPVNGLDTRGLVMKLPCYEHLPVGGWRRCNLNVRDFNCDRIVLPGPDDDVTWRVTCAIVYTTMGGKQTACAHYVAYRRLPAGGDHEPKSFIKVDDSNIVGPPRVYDDFRDIDNVYMLVLERN